MASLMKLTLSSDSKKRSEASEEQRKFLFKLIHDKLRESPSKLSLTIDELWKIIRDMPSTRKGLTHDSFH